MSYKKNSTNTHFTVDFLEKKIIGTRACFNKAGKGISPYYEDLAAKVKAHPDFSLEVKEQKKRTPKPKRTYDGLDYAFMVAYIKIQANPARRMAEYNAVKKLAKESKKSVYPFTKQWFLKEFGSAEKGFDMEKAKQEINDALMSEAVQAAAPAVINDAA